jgi:N-acetyl sugar amidotransferase
LSAVRYCRSCILPDTRPGLEFDSAGVCSACRAHGAKRQDVDWTARAAQFEQLVDRVRARGAAYDCLLPVSGGKDSTWQTMKCLELGLRPLAVTWKTPARTALGQANLDNLVGLGVDHIDFQVNPVVERRFMVKALERFGSTAIPMHMAIFSIPLQVAVRYDVPLVVFGENTATEYVGAHPGEVSFRLDREWVRRFGVVHGTTADDWVDGELSERDMTPYRAPSDAELAARGIEAVFLGMFYEWDPVRTAELAAAAGFRSDTSGPRTGLYDFADIDDDFISLHHWLKWPKFGFTRTYDNLALEIRNGRITREEAIATLRERGDETPHGDIERFCSYTGPSREWWDATFERFRNRDVWTRRADGTWVIEDFLITDWEWN